MTTRTFITTAALAAALGCASPPPEQQFLDDALRAVGGRARVEAATSIVIEGAGVNYNLGQDIKPEAATQTFELSPYSRRIDLQNGRQIVEQTRVPKFAFFQGMQPQTQVQALDGDVAFNLNAKGEATRIGALAERDRQVDFFHHPITALKAAATGGSVTNVRSAGALRLADVAVRDRKWTMTIDAAGLPLSVSSPAYNINLGDVTITTTFAQYQDVNGLKLPAQINTKVDDFTTAEIHATRQTVGTDISAPQAPAAIASKPVSPAPPNVTVENIGTGVWFLAGQGHHSVLVEFSDHLMLIEAPQSEARTLAVIARARDIAKNKPLTQVVTTHHHFDHTAGLRAAISEGLTVITHAGNKEWVENMARRPHTRQPDALTKKANRLVVETVDSEQEIKDASQTVMLYHVAGNPHSDTMLMAYMPRDRLLVEVDAFSPGSAAQPYAPNLLENITKRNLRVDRIVPLHGAIAPFAELVKAAGAK